MKIGLIIFSQSGNTRSVAEKIRDRLNLSGHEAVIDEIRISGKVPAEMGKFKIEHSPSPDQYDAVIFGAPVQAFSLNPVMKEYMGKMPPLKGKKVVLYITKQLPLLFAGGTGSIALMKKACEDRGAKVIETGMVVWSDKKRQQSVKENVDKIVSAFS